MPGQIKDYLHGYRADPTKKHGGKDYMETLPKELDKYTLSSYVKAMQEGKPYGVPQLTREQLANIALHEGRDDFGLNLANSKNKKVKWQRKNQKGRWADHYFIFDLYFYYLLFAIYF